MGEGRFKVSIEDKYGVVTDEYSFDQGELIIGRSSKSDIVLPGDNVSRSHAKLFTKDNNLFIQDLDSANGTFVNGKRITKAEILLDGSIFRIGDFHIHAHGGPSSLDQEKCYLRLIGMNGPVKDEVFEIKDKTALIGRGEDCQLVVIDPSISRIHARFLVMDDGLVMVKDLGSANGVYVNNKPITTWELHSGDNINFGDVRFKVEIPGASTSLTKVGWKLPELYRPSPISILIVVVVVLLLVLLGVTVWHYHKKAGLAVTQKTHKVLKPQPQPQPHKKLSDISGLVSQGRQFLKAGDLESAMVFAEKAEKVSPTDPSVLALKNDIKIEKMNKTLFNKGQDLIKRGEDGKAMDVLLNIPEKSVFYAGMKSALRLIKQDLISKQKKQCKTRRQKKKISCIRIRAMLKKIDDVLSYKTKTKKGLKPAKKHP